LPDRDGYITGAPCRAGTSQPDRGAAAKFYGGLFGWASGDAMRAAPPGRYLVARLRGSGVAAVSSPPGERPCRRSGIPTSGSRTATRRGLSKWPTKTSAFPSGPTPIETTDRSTRKASSPQINGKYENYLDALLAEAGDRGRGDRRDALRARASRGRPLRGQELDRSFEALVGDLPEEKQEKVRDDAARLQVIAKAPARIEAIVADAAYYLRERTFPQGFKAHGAAAEGAGGVRNPV
jgi:hypothetical protein